MLVATNGRVAADELTHVTGTGPRWLQRQFKSSVGFGPKLLGRLCRFQSLLGRLEERPGGWAGAAAEHGYYDQSHLIRDFHAIAGTSPKRSSASRTRWRSCSRSLPDGRIFPIRSSRTRTD